MFEIIKNAELPPKCRNNGRKTKYPFAQMEVGDGFDAPDDMGKAATGGSKRRSSVTACAKQWCVAYNPTAKFATRSMPETGMVRCVRIA